MSHRQTLSPFRTEFVSWIPFLTETVNVCREVFLFRSVAEYYVLQVQDTSPRQVDLEAFFGFTLAIGNNRQDNNTLKDLLKANIDKKLQTTISAENSTTHSRIYNQQPDTDTRAVDGNNVQGTAFNQPLMTSVPMSEPVESDSNFIPMEPLLTNTFASTAATAHTDLLTVSSSGSATTAIATISVKPTRYKLQKK